MQGKLEGIIGISKNYVLLSTLSPLVSYNSTEKQR